MVADGFDPVAVGVARKRSVGGIAAEVGGPVVATAGGGAGAPKASTSLRDDALKYQCRP